jgi:hypothetical protein
MALQAAHDLSKAGGPRELAIQQGKELALGRKAADPVIRFVLTGETVKLGPRNPLHQVVENAILVSHGVASVFVSRRRANV